MDSPAETGSILIVDDDHAVRKLVANLLARNGYATLSADSGEIALQVFEEHRADIALLLTDITMPGINGLELARRIQRAKPNLPVLVMSALSGRPNETGEFASLPKPFIAPDLLTRVRETLAHAC